MKNTLFLAHSIDILVRLLTVNMKNFLTPKLHSSNSIESATPSSGTSPLASYKEVSHPGFKAVSLVRILLRGPLSGGGGGGGRSTYLPRLKFKSGRSAYWRGGLVAVGILLWLYRGFSSSLSQFWINFISFVVNLSVLCCYFKATWLIGIWPYQLNTCSLRDNTRLISDEMCRL